MKLLDRYVITLLLKVTALALLGLLSVFAFLSLIDQLEETGRGDFTVYKATVYVLLTLPRLAYDLLPIATVIGSMTTLGLLAHHSELIVIRTSGVPLFRIAWMLVKGGLIIVLFALIVGEGIAPYADQYAQNMRSIALSEKITLKTRDGMWTRDGMSFINIRKVLPGDRLEQIYIYEFDADDRLRVSTYARSANYTDNQWQLADIRQTFISTEQIQTSTSKYAAWSSLLSPEVINLVSSKPQHLTLWGLLEYIRYLNMNGQNSRPYELAVWSKLTYPLVIIMMVVLAAPLISSYSRMVAVSQRVFTGCLIGISFHILNQVSSQTGLVYGLPPLISVSFPLLLVGGLTAWFINKSA